MWKTKKDHDFQDKRGEHLKFLPHIPESVVFLKSCLIEKA